MNRKTILLTALLVIISTSLGYVAGYVSINNEEKENIKDDSQEQKENNESINDNINTSKDDFNDNVEIKLPVGYYIYDSNEPGYDYIGIHLKEDGTADIFSGMYNGGGSSGNGIYAIGKDKLYIYNNECKVTYVFDECTYPNYCTNIYSFDYINGNIKENNIILEKVSETKYNELKSKSKSYQ